MQLILVVVVGLLAASSAEPEHLETAAIYSCQDGDEIDIKCPSEVYTLDILQVFYGRDSADICPFGNEPETDTSRTDCSLMGAKDVVTYNCQGMHECQIEPTNKYFGADPCPGTYKYVKVMYRCIVLT